MKASLLKSFIKEQILQKISSTPVKEGYYGSTSIEDTITKIGYESFEDFFTDNPGGEEALQEWIEGIPEFRGMLGIEDEDMNEATFEVPADKLDSVKSKITDKDIVKVTEEDDEDDKEAIAAANAAKGKFKKLDLAVKALKDITTEMKSLAKKYSVGDEVEKEKIKNILKTKTSRKKELEALVDKLEQDVV
tara:strand:+ start:1348 stop:1920 length:573 start_codon:yes stop_codon:yes gene_type:complete